MSTNVYPYEERITFGKDPVSYYGWYISSSSDDVKIAQFESEAIRDGFEKKVDEIVEHAFGPDHHFSPDLLAAVAVALELHQVDYADLDYWTRGERDELGEVWDTIVEAAGQQVRE